MRRVLVNPVAVFIIVALIGSGAILILWSLGYLPPRATGGFSQGPVQTEARTVAAFSTLTVDGPLRVTITEGPPSLTLTGPRAALVKIQVAAEGENLVLLYAGTAELEEPLSASLSGRGIYRMVAAGGAVIDAKGGLGRDLALDVSGTAKVTLAGTCRGLDLEARHAAQIAAGAFACARVSARLSDAARAKILARSALDADVSGVAELVYGGQPGTLVKKLSGAGRIEEMSANEP